MSRKLDKNKAHKRFHLIEEDIVQILTLLIESNEINIRQLKNIETFDFSVSFFDYYKDQYVTMHPYWHLLNFLLKVFNNDRQKLKAAFSNAVLDKEEMKFFSRRKDVYLKSLVLLADIERVDKSLRNSGAPDFLYKNEELDISIKYSLLSGGDYLLANIQDIGYYNAEELKLKTDIGFGIKEYTREITLSDIFGLFTIAIEEIILFCTI